MLTDSTPPWSNMRTIFFTAGSHVAIMFSFFIGAIVTAISSDAEFTIAIVAYIVGTLSIYTFSAVIISFFSSSFAAQSGGNNIICATGPVAGNVISFLLLAFLLSLLIDDNNFFDIVEAFFNNGAILASMCMHLCASTLGIMLLKIK